MAQRTIQPAAMELITGNAIEFTRPFVPSGYPLADAPVQAMLLVEWEEHIQQAVDQAADECFDILQSFEPLDIFLASSKAESDLVWSMRNRIGEAMTHNGSRYRDIDACVPPASVHEFLLQVEKLVTEYGQQLICFGHIMDGNLHTMLLMPPGEEYVSVAKINALLQDIYREVVRLGGTISGEHGIGCLQKDFLSLQLSPVQLSLMQQIKQVLDPAGILNPGKNFMTTIPGKPVQAFS